MRAAGAGLDVPNQVRGTGRVATSATATHASTSAATNTARMRGSYGGPTIAAAVPYPNGGANNATGSPDQRTTA